MTMNTNPKNVVSTNPEFNYYLMPKCFASAKNFVSKVTGSAVEFSYIDKLVLMHLIDMVSFHNSEGRTMFESMPAIAEAIGMSAKSVQRSVKKLCEHAVVRVSAKHKTKGNVYEAIDIHQRWSAGEVSTSNVERMKPNPIKQKTRQVVINEVGDDLPEWMAA